MSEEQVEGTRLTSVQLLDVAIWREIGSDEPQPAPAFLEALAALVGRWLLVRSAAPEMDAVSVLCRVRGYIERSGRSKDELRRSQNGTGTRLMEGAAMSLGDFKDARKEKEEGKK